MHEFFQSHHSKVTFPFLQPPPTLPPPFRPPSSSQAQFLNSFTTDFFRKLIDLHYEVSWSDSSYDEAILSLELLSRERLICLQFNLTQYSPSAVL